MKKAHKRLFSSILILLFFIYTLNSQNTTNDNSSNNQRPKMPISELRFFRNAYPDIQFSQKYDREEKDWIITITVENISKNGKSISKSTDLYWANGSFLPKEELINADKYWPLLYKYQKELTDPAEYTEEEKKAIKEYGSSESRKNGAGTPMFFFDAIYNSDSRRNIEQHIIKTKFLGNPTNIHNRIAEPLARVEKGIYQLAALAEETEEVEKNTESLDEKAVALDEKIESNTQEKTILLDEETIKEAQEAKNFLANIKSNDAYYWRIIAGTKRKSFHSLGIAVDVLPKNLGRKQIFWNWAKIYYPDTWMLIPLKDRWIPPECIIRIFEEEGFIWGGKWVIFDNMHFEYRPELILYNYYNQEGEVSP
ncbi:MAG: M15 family metallopeptidase [Treponema sp.]|nr:M15 family metallopeptidase [Treponema sp.]